MANYQDMANYQEINAEQMQVGKLYSIRVGGGWIGVRPEKLELDVTGKTIYVHYNGGLHEMGRKEVVRDWR